MRTGAVSWDVDARHSLFHGRRKGRPLRQGQQALIENRLPDLLMPPPPETVGTVDLSGVFDPPVRAVWLEIGFGGGEHLAWQAEHNPDVGIIGCEPFVNGVASLLRHIAHGGLRNVRIHPDDARPLIEALPSGGLERVFLLHPDPWPKRRHHGRRLVQRGWLDRMWEVLVPGGLLRLATDDVGYLRWMLARLTAHPGFRWTGTQLTDLTDRRADWPETRYETKARRQGRSPAYLEFRRH
ncbi:MAG: tRNA (guanosine(46)-N7)-methyltransferase TrmB [Alphaproteobacteria bacterium]|nr:tRNA (guanosine(46)-N7)-methyltransferase TrmB [Alphaproteobacteria bacterium]